ncbi:MAG: DNA recombination protein RmuC [Gammaproteobacteria bacterium]|nr:DNA recombination protein RmuC [Gammaproteobacteria bacterium]
MDLVGILIAAAAAVITVVVTILWMRTKSGERELLLKNEMARLETRSEQIPKLESQLNDKEAELQQLQQQLNELQLSNTQLTTRIESEREHHQQQLKDLDEARKKMVSEFENIANRVIDEKGKRFDENNRKGMDEILKPVREQLKDFRSRVDEIHHNDVKERAGLKEHLVQLQQLNQDMNREARNLTRALKGDKKTQGNWGELVLERVLEQSGLRKGIEYETQGSYRDSENRLLRPDVIVHLPEGKDIVVDSKVSLVDYNRYVEAEDEKEQEKALAELVNSVRNHIKGLSSKDYTDLKGVRSLDFVLMFMPIETAFVAAFQSDEKLFSDAFEQKIIVVTPTTLLATLRTIENIWRYERQNQNAIKIADKASAVYDKLRGFIEDFEKIGTQLTTVQGSYDSALNKLTGGRGNLIKQAGDFVELGVKVKKEMPKSITESSD